ncbi:hypothetical protein Tco_0739534 [Tanacetum coccineum]
MMSLSVRRTRDEAVYILAWQLTKVAAMAVEPLTPDVFRFNIVSVVGLKNVIKACKEFGTVEKIVYRGLELRRETAE